MLSSTSSTSPSAALPALNVIKLSDSKFPPVSDTLRDEEYLQAEQEKKKKLEEKRLEQSTKARQSAFIKMLSAITSNSAPFSPPSATNNSQVDKDKGSKKQEKEKDNKQEKEKTNKQEKEKDNKQERKRQTDLEEAQRKLAIEEEERQKLGVVKFTPEGNLSSNAPINIRIVFNHPLQTNSNKDSSESSASSALGWVPSISPKLDGQWQFEDPNSPNILIFKSSNNLQNATEYQVTIPFPHAKAITGKQFASGVDFSWTFSTPVVHISSIWIEKYYNQYPLNAVVVVKFDQLVSPEQIIKVCELTVQTSKRKSKDNIVLLQTSEIQEMSAKNSEFANLIKPTANNNKTNSVDYIAFRPTTQSEYAATFSLTIGPMISSLEGSLVNTFSKQKVSWTTIALLDVYAQVKVLEDGDCTATFTFSQDMADETQLQPDKNVSSEFAVPSDLMKLITTHTSLSMLAADEKTVLQQFVTTDHFEWTIARGCRVLTARTPKGKPLALSTAFEIAFKPGFKNHFGSTITEIARFDIKTPRNSISSIVPSTNWGPEQPFAILLKQPMSIEKLEPNVKLYVSGILGKRLHSNVTIVDIKDFPELGNKIVNSGYATPNVYVFKPSKPLPYSCDVFVKIDSLLSNLGPLVSDEHNFQFRTISPFLATAMNWQKLQIIMSHPISPTNTVFPQLSPMPPNSKWQVHASSIFALLLDGKQTAPVLALSTKYTVTLPVGVASTFEGATTQKQFQEELETQRMRITNVYPNTNKVLPLRPVNLNNC